MQLNRENINYFLNDIGEPIARTINRVITALIIIWSGILVAETYQTTDNINWIIDVIDITILLIFVVEYHFRFYLWIVNSTIKDENTYYLILDLIAILPYSLAAINPIFLYWLGWLRILRLLRFIHKKFLFIRIPDETLIFSRLLYTFFAIIFIFSGVIYQVEYPNNELFSSFIDTVYFSIVTITTVGFGDVTPNSELGRFLTILMILFGSVLILPQVGDSIKQLIQSANKVSDSCDPNSDVRNQDS